MKSISILVYLNSGSGDGKKVLAFLQAACRKKNINFKIYKTEYKEHAKTLIKKVIKESKKEDRIVIIGGDGTLNECITSLSKLDKKIPVSYLPAGTGNDFKRSLNLTGDCEKFLDNIFLKEAEEIEYLNIKDEQENYYVAMNGVGIGFDALIAHMTNESKKKKLLSNIKLSKLSYQMKIISAFINRKLFNATIIADDNIKKEHKNILFATFMKNPYFGGGIKIIPTAKKNDGKIFLALAKDIYLKDLIKLLPHVLKTGKHFGRTEKFTLEVAKKFRIKIEGKSYMQTDGEINLVENTTVEIGIKKYPFYLVEK